MVVRARACFARPRHWGQSVLMGLRNRWQRSALVARTALEQGTQCFPGSTIRVGCGKTRLAGLQHGRFRMPAKTWSRSSTLSYVTGRSLCASSTCCSSARSDAIVSAGTHIASFAAAGARIACFVPELEPGVEVRRVSANAIGRRRGLAPEWALHTPLSRRFFIVYAPGSRA